jgi:DNA-binding CsgD family transcriptional regulator
LAELISAPALSNLIGAIYDCALDPDRWVATLGLIRETLNFDNAVLQLHALPSGEALLNIGSGVEPAWWDRMIRSGPDVLELWGGEAVYHALPLDEPAVLSRINPRGLSVEGGNRFALEWGRPQGLIDVMGIVLARDASAMGSIGLGRHECAGPIGDREISLARLLIPHLQRAAAISGLLDSKSLATRTFELLIDRLAVPIFLIGAGLRIVHANTAAQRLLAAGDPLQSKGGLLAPRSEGVAAALALAIDQGRADESALGRRGFGVPAYTHDRKLRVLHVLPLRYGELRPGLAPSAVAAVFVAPTMPGLPAGGDVLAALFNLTPAESRVFELIAAGRTSAETATALGVGVSTIKTHLLRLFDKVGVRRQADLVALAASFALPVDSAGRA